MTEKTVPVKWVRLSLHECHASMTFSLNILTIHWCTFS